jgi:hypothetical protein
MKRNYDTRLLFIGIYLILAQIVSFTLQRFFGDAHLTLSFGIDIALCFLIAFFYIAQFKKFHFATTVVMLVYSGINLLYAFVSKSMTQHLFTSFNFSVFFVLALLTAYALMAISSIFLTIHVTQKRFEEKFTFKLIVSSLGVTTILLTVAAILVTSPTVADIVTVIFTIISMAVLFLGNIFTILSPTIEYNEHPDKVTKHESKLDELFKKGLITEDEYNLRKNKVHE